MLIPYSSYKIHYELADETTTEMLVNSFIINRVDYCNSILAGIPNYQISRVQSILNVAARVIYYQARFDHVIPTLRDRLNWLRVSEWIQFKRCLLVYKVLLPISPSSAPLSHQVGVNAHLCSSNSAFHVLPRRSYLASYPSLSVA